MVKITPESALQKLAGHDKRFRTLFTHGTLEVEIYSPNQVDLQEPHQRDEIYVVIAGRGTFFCAGERIDFAPGDFLFVPAGIEHRFESFSDDFSTWVFFYGPEGGEKTEAPNPTN